MAFEFWFIDEQNNIRLLLPVTPGEYSLDEGNEMEIVRATEKGDLNIAGHKKLKNIRFEGLFTTYEYPFLNKVTYPVSHAMDYINLLKKWVDSKTIIRFIIANEGVTRVNEEFYVENINYSEDNKSNGDINYIIDLREYRPMNTPKVDTKSVAMVQNESRIQGATKKKANTYTVISGDYLIKIARKVYGDGNKWRKIYDANKSVIGKNPNLIYPGQVYTIP